MAPDLSSYRVDALLADPRTDCRLPVRAAHVLAANA